MQNPLISRHFDIVSTSHFFPASGRCHGHAGLTVLAKSRFMFVCKSNDSTSGCDFFQFSKYFILTPMRKCYFEESGDTFNCALLFS